MSDTDKNVHAEADAAATAEQATEGQAESAQADPRQLAEELEQAQAKVNEYWQRYLGAKAEIENVRKRGERELANAHKYALEKFVNELLPVKDSLEMGLAAANETADIEKLKEGKEQTLKMLSGALEKFGVRELDPLGEKFNPERHEAMAMQPNTEVEPNTVLQVVRKGYVLNERLVRPAMVVVAKAAEKSSSGS
ncbi:MAG: nucleotide exchange factor GrpE [Candidatus Competibacterales bacterium]|nr:nucleotide exchange factor GrpE [Candidatus Competibacterales bacterium]